MIKKISITFLFIIILFIAFLIYLSIYGIETTKFNSLIKNEIKSYNSKLDIKVKSVKLLLEEERHFTKSKMGLNYGEMQDITKRL